MLNVIRYPIRRLPITLLEVLIVFVLMALVTGVVATSIHKALVEQRFRTEVSLIVEELRLAQNIMSILKTDVRVVFEEDPSKKGINYRLELDTILPPNIQHEVQRLREKLMTVKGVFFHDELAAEIKEGHLDIKFLSSGAVMSRGIMRLATTDNENPPPGTLETYICLVGYPHPIVNVDRLEDAEKQCSKDDEDFNRRLTEETMSKVPEKVKEVEPSSQVVEGRQEKEKALESKQLTPPQEGKK